MKRHLLLNACLLVVCLGISAQDNALVQMANATFSNPQIAVDSFYTSDPESFEDVLLIVTTIMVSKDDLLGASTVKTGTGSAINHFKLSGYFSSDTLSSGSSQITEEMAELFKHIIENGEHEKYPWGDIYLLDIEATDKQGTKFKLPDMIIEIIE